MPCTKQQLTKPQLEAIDGTGPQLILAGPGSGKTCVVTQKIAHLLQSDVKPENLLALTFSEKAAAEMADKLAEMADRGELKIDVSDLTIGTFHSFCLELLRDNVLDSGISVTSILSETNQLDWARRHLDSFAFEHIEIGNNEINVIESIFQGISALRDELITPDKLQEYLKKKEGTQLEEEEEAYLGKLMDVLKVYRAYVAYKQQERLIDFDDMIMEASQLLERKPDLLRRYRARYQYIIVDEFQDTNYPQFRLITQLASENICVFGDDDQSIYRFRGAYLTSFNDFKAQFSECHKTLLDANFRNSGNIFACAQQLMRSAPHRIDKTLTTVNADGDKLVIACCENEQAEVQFVCDAIERLVRDPERPRAYHDIALLSRRRIDAAKFQAALRERNIPCESVGEVDFFAEPIIRDALAYLRVIQNPMRAGISLNRIMRRCGITEANAQRLNARAELHARADDASDGVYDCMCDGNTALLTQAEELRELTDAIARMLALKDRTRVSELVYKVTVRRTDLYRRSVRHRNKRDVQLLNELNKLAQQYESTTPEPELSGFLDYLGLPGFQIELGESEDTDSVKALTVHQSKGMEFPVVFLVDAATNRFPSRFKERPFYVPHDLGRGEQTEDDDRSLHEQEERRLFYVAMTRAEQKLYITYAERYGQNIKRAKRSKFLYELESGQQQRIEFRSVHQQTQTTPVETGADTTCAAVQDSAIQAIDAMQLKRAVQKIVDLEKLRLLKRGEGLEHFDRDAFLAVEDNDAEITALYEGKPAPLVSAEHHFSASSLQMYSACPAQYKFGHVLRVPEPPRTYFQLGKVVHRVIELLTAQELEGLSPTLARAYELLAREWSSDPYSTQQKEGEDSALAQQLLETYLAWNARNENRVVGAEMKFEFMLNGRSVVGYIDRVEQTPTGEYVVVDFKTGYPTENKNTVKDNIQMNVYALAVLDKFGKLPQRATFFYVNHDKTVDYFPEQEQIDRQKARLSAMIDAVLDERFPELPSYHTCRSCSYQDLCEQKETKAA